MALKIIETEKLAHKTRQKLYTYKDVSGVVIRLNKQVTIDNNLGKMQRNAVEIDSNGNVTLVCYDFSCSAQFNKLASILLEDT